jgi:hypothetical protein
MIGDVFCDPFAWVLRRQGESEIQECAAMVLCVVGEFIRAVDGVRCLQIEADNKDRITSHVTINLTPLLAIIRHRDSNQVVGEIAMLISPYKCTLPCSTSVDHSFSSRSHAVDIITSRSTMSHIPTCATSVL